MTLTPAERVTYRAVDRARECLRAAGLRAYGAPVLPARPQSPDGEVEIGSNHPTFIGFYSSAPKARRLEPSIRSNAKRFHGEVERRGTVTIIWTASPAAGLRRTVQACVFTG